MAHHNVFLRGLGKRIVHFVASIMRCSFCNEQILGYLSSGFFIQSCFHKNLLQLSFSFTTRHLRCTLTSCSLPFQKQCLPKTVVVVLILRYLPSLHGHRPKDLYSPFSRGSPHSALLLPGLGHGSAGSAAGFYTHT